MSKKELTQDPPPLLSPEMTSRREPCVSSSPAEFDLMLNRPELEVLFFQETTHNDRRCSGVAAV